MPRIIFDRIIPHYVDAFGPVSGQKSCHVTFRGYSAREAKPEIRYEIQNLTDISQPFAHVCSLGFLLDDANAMIYYRIGHDSGQEPIGQLDIQWIDTNNWGERTPIGPAVTCNAYRTMVFQAVAVPENQGPIAILNPSIFVARDNDEYNRMRIWETPFSN